MGIIGRYRQPLTSNLGIYLQIFDITTIYDVRIPSGMSFVAPFPSNNSTG
jgi:hypothetical protein